MPKFRLKSKAFIAPTLFPEGAVIDYDGPLGINFEAVDEEGEELLRQWYEKNPHAGNPIDALPIRVAPPMAEATMVEAPPPPVEKSITTLANPGRARPGPTELSGKRPK
jgi:hypothetical protein